MKDEQKQLQQITEIINYIIIPLLDDLHNAHEPNKTNSIKLKLNKANRQFAIIHEIMANLMNIKAIINPDEIPNFYKIQKRGRPKSL